MNNDILPAACFLQDDTVDCPLPVLCGTRNQCTQNLACFTQSPTFAGQTYSPTVLPSSFPTKPTPTVTLPSSAPQGSESKTLIPLIAVVICVLIVALCVIYLILKYLRANKRKARFVSQDTSSSEKPLESQTYPSINRSQLLLAAAFILQHIILM
jgi:hypothetical protein